MSFPAKHPGRCPSCDGRIHEGDEITRTGDGWVHAGCPDDEPAASRPVEVCGSCWLTKPCGCEDLK